MSTAGWFFHPYTGRVRSPNHLQYLDPFFPEAHVVERPGGCVEIRIREEGLHYVTGWHT
jgi:hypothetical protein